MSGKNGGLHRFVHGGAMPAAPRHPAAAFYIQNEEGVEPRDELPRFEYEKR